MPRYIDAEKLKEQKFVGVQFEHYFRIVSDGRVKTDDEIYAYKVGYNEAIDNIADFAPTADVVERKRGKWIRHSIGHENTPWGFDCSACGKWFVIGEDSAEKYHYCPNCGADMRGEDE